MANRPVPRTLTRAQQARRQRVVDAAMTLGLDGGYEAVQMRDVAALADVAMGTVYRYFTSKDHLLAAALVHWVEQLDSAVGPTPCSRRLGRRSGHRRPRPGAPGHGPPATAGRSRLHRARLPGPRRHRVPAAGVTADGGDHHPGHRRAPPSRHRRPGPHPRPRLVLGTGGVGQRLEQHGPGPRRAGGRQSDSCSRPTSTPRS